MLHYEKRQLCRLLYMRHRYQNINCVGDADDDGVEGDAVGSTSVLQKSDTVGPITQCGRLPKSMMFFYDISSPTDGVCSIIFNKNVIGLPTTTSLAT